MSWAIKIEGLSKLYPLGGVTPLGSNLREDLLNWLGRFARNAGASLQPSRTAAPSECTDPSLRDAPPGKFWALRDIDLKIGEGEVVGIIGRNGSGKSTLLKILSRITQPTTGTIQYRGRLASLLEVGSGFHRELTGRENIFLNGSILGMRRGEIARKLDEIVAFSEVEKFLDTPVKFYSSGMYVRLAFAVAANLEADVLIVDEVLAVGDAAFQKKCLGKMQEVAEKQGRTVLFVSHNMGVVGSLCTRGVVLQQGLRKFDGPAREAIARYIELGRRNRGEQVWPDPATAPGGDRVRLHAVRVLQHGRATDEVEIDQPVEVAVDFWTRKPGLRLTANLHLIDKMSVEVLSTTNWPSANLRRDELAEGPLAPGLYRSVCAFPANFFNDGVYSINAFILSDTANVEAACREAVCFQVNDTGHMRQEGYGGDWLGVIRPKLAWHTTPLDDASAGLPPGNRLSLEAA